MCVSDHVGDLMTFDIWSDATKQVIQRSAIRSADPKKGSIRNKRVNFEDETNQEDPEIIDAAREMPSLAQSSVKPTEQHHPTTSPARPLVPKCPTLKANTPLRRTRKHKVKWHNTTEATEDQANGTIGFEDANCGKPDDFGPKITTMDLNQSHPLRRKRRQ